MTLWAALLWVAAALVAGALAYWDYTESTPSSPAREPATPSSDVEIDLIYQEGE